MNKDVEKSVVKSTNDKRPVKLFHYFIDPELVFKFRDEAKRLKVKKSKLLEIILENALK